MVCEVAHRLLARKHHQSLVQLLGGSMKVGDLVRDIADPRVPYGIVVGQHLGQTDRWFIRWFTGYFQGKTNSRWRSHLEVL